MTNNLNILETHCRNVIFASTEEEQKIAIKDLLLKEDSILANFKLLIETYITKRYNYNENGRIAGYTLEFDLDKGQNLIWDMLFLSRIVLENADASTIEEIEQKINNRFEYDQIDVKITGITESQNNSPIINDIKRAIVICQKLRDAFSHTGEDKKYKLYTTKIDVNSDYKKNMLKTIFPFKYLDEFGSGINSSFKDEKIASEIDEKVFAICNDKNLKMTNFFYRFHPERVNFIMGLSEKDINLLSLPKGIFSKECSEERITTIYEGLGKDIDQLSSVPSVLFECTDDTFNKLMSVVNKNDIGESLIEYLNVKLPSYLSSIIIDPELLNYVLELLNGNINDLNKLPVGIFTSKKDRIEKILLLLADNNKEEMLSTDNIGKLLDTRLCPILFSKNCSIERIEYLKKCLNLELNQLGDYPSEVFLCDKNKLEYVFSLFKDINDFKANPSLYRFLFVYDVSIERINNLLSLVDNDVTKLRGFALSKVNQDFDKKKLEYLIGKLQDSNREVVDFSKLPYIVFDDRCSIERIERLLTFIDGDILRLIELPDEVFIENKTINLVKSKSMPFVTYSDEKKEFLKRLNVSFEDEIQDSKISYKELPIEIFKDECSIERIEGLIRLADGDIRKLKNFPHFAFRYHTTLERIEYLLKLVSKGLEKDTDTNEINNYNIISLKDLPNVLSRCSIKEDRINNVLKLVNGDYTSLKQVPRKLFSVSNEVFESLVEITNGDINKLRKLPQEYYRCSNGDMVKTLYQSSEFSPTKKELLQSVFSFKDEKTIALILYMNAIFSGYSKNNQQGEHSKEEVIENLSTKGLEININHTGDTTLETSSSSLYNRLLIELKNGVDGAINVLNNHNVHPSSSIFTRPKDKVGEIRRTIGKQNTAILSSIRNCVCHFHITEHENGTITIYNEVNTDRGEPVRKFEVKATKEDLFRFVSDYRKDILPFSPETLAKEIDKRRKFVKDDVDTTLFTIDIIKSYIEAPEKLIALAKDKLGITFDDEVVSLDNSPILKNR